MSRRSSVTLFEHERLHVGAPLRGDPPGSTFSEAHFDALARYNDAHGGRFFRLGHRSIGATQHVGYVEVGDLSIEILPKADRAAPADRQTWREGVLAMLRVAARLKLAKPTPAAQSADRSPLLDVLAERFLIEVDQLLHQGLARSYRGIEVNGPTFRGKLLVSQQLRHNLVRDDRFYVATTTFDADTVVNRILATALAVLAERALPPSLTARLAALRLAFPETTSLAIHPGTFDRLPLGRATARYADALALARIILARHAPNLKSGAAPVFAVLFDMNELWEAYIAALFRRNAPDDLHVSTQRDLPFWREPSVSPRTVAPDIVVTRGRGGPVVMVGDTKWKVPEAGKPSDDDLKQMFVYNELLGSPLGVLLYPAAGASVGRAGRFEGRQHELRCLHLGGEAAGRWDEAAIVVQVRGLLASVSGEAGVASGAADARG